MGTNSQGQLLRNETVRLGYIIVSQRIRYKQLLLLWIFKYIQDSLVGDITRQAAVACLNTD